jgi:hypothetical protein
MQEEMDRLERDIGLLSRGIVFPPTPSLASRVRNRIEQRSHVRAPASPWSLALTAVAAAAVALAFVAGVVAPAREAVADLFDRINIFETDEVPQDLTRDITGTPLSLDGAEDALGFRLLLPSEPERLDPQEVLLQDFGQVKAAVIFFRHPNGTPFALFETDARVGKGLPTIGKGIVESAQAQPVFGVGNEAYWLTGLRIVQYYEPDGAVIQQSVRATDVNTLLWDHDGRVFRIEGNLSQEEAVEIAKSLR